jgi:hypothetical protein
MADEDRMPVSAENLMQGTGVAGQVSPTPARHMPGPRRRGRYRAVPNARSAFMFASRTTQVRSASA